MSAPTGSTPRRVLVAGCGDLGTQAALGYLARGDQVVGLRRRADVLPAPIVGWSGDLTTPLTLPETLRAGVDVLVITPAAPGRDEDSYRRTYLDGAHHVLDAIERHGPLPPQVLLVSSTGVYGVGGDVDETTDPDPRRPTARVLLEAEGHVRARVPHAVVLRLAGIYGPGRTRLIDQVRAGEARIGDPDVTTNRIHRDDAARAIVALTTDVEDPPPTVLGVDDAPVPKGEVLRFLAAELGLPEPPTTTAPSDRATDKRCSNALLRSLGFDLIHPTYREGYRAVLAGHGTRHQ